MMGRVGLQQGGVIDFGETKLEKDDNKCDKKNERNNNDIVRNVFCFLFVCSRFISVWDAACKTLIRRIMPLPNSRETFQKPSSIACLK